MNIHNKNVQFSVPSTVSTCCVGMTLIKEQNGQVPVDHACYSSNSEGRDQEDHSSKPTQAISS
jgi:hypothetical protein